MTAVVSRAGQWARRAVVVLLVSAVSLVSPAGVVAADVTPSAPAPASPAGPAPADTTPSAPALAPAVPANTGPANTGPAPAVPIAPAVPSPGRFRAAVGAPRNATQQSYELDVTWQPSKHADSYSVVIASRTGPGGSVSATVTGTSFTAALRPDTGYRVTVTATSSVNGEQRSTSSSLGSRGVVLWTLLPYGPRNLEVSPNPFNANSGLHTCAANSMISWSAPVGGAPASRQEWSIRSRKTGQVVIGGTVRGNWMDNLFVDGLAAGRYELSVTSLDDGRHGTVLRGYTARKSFTYTPIRCVEDGEFDKPYWH